MLNNNLRLKQRDLNNKKKQKEIKQKVSRNLQNKKKHIFNNYFRSYKIGKRISKNKNTNFKKKNKDQEKRFRKKKLNFIKEKDNCNKDL
jgi:hypothetical protein